MRYRSLVKHLVFSCICGSMFFHTSLLLAQDEPQIIPPSPNAAAIQKFAEMPVSAYTGLPNISVPIYEIVAGDLRLPIDLSYHAGGIKVDEEASWVGLGWALNAGGAITRTVIGNDDFDPAFNYFDSLVYSFPEGYHPMKYYNLGCSTTFINNISADSIAVDLSAYLSSSANEPYEFEADQYSYNFLSESGSFILKRNYKPVLARQKKIDISLKQDGTSWTIVMDTGIKYTFDKYESYTDYQISRPVITAWYLTEIESLTGEKITFHYDVDNTFIRPLGSVYEQEWFNGTSGDGVQTSPDGNHVCFKDKVFQITEQKAYTNITLAYIDFQHGRVTFDYDTIREDLNGGKRLNSVQIFNKTLDGIISQSYEKKIIFNYDYFIGIGDIDFDDPNGNNNSYLNNRLKLQSIQEVSANESKGSYVFTYFEGGPLSLPSKHSFARDHWGYYNGALSNNTLIPEFKGVLDKVFGEKPQYVELEGANREPNPAYMKAFSLQSIKYPTGGQTTFDFEAHTFDPNKSKVNDFSLTQRELFIEDQITTLSTQAHGEVVTKTLDVQKGYVPEGSASVEVYLDAVFRLTNPGAPTPSSSGRVYFELYRDNGSRESLVDITDATCDSSLVCTYTNTYQLIPGVYTWKAYMSNDTNIINNIQEIRANYHWEEEKSLSLGQEALYYAGGLRVSDIISHDELYASEDIYQKFDYHYQADSDGDGILETLSYGRRMSRPIYSHFRQHIDSHSISGSTTVYQCYWYIRSSMSNIPINGTAKGSIVGYDQVSVLYGKDKFGNYGIGGRTTYEYENHPDVIRYYDRWRPPGINNQVSQRNGLLIQKTEYAFLNGDYQTVRQVTNNYLNSKNPVTIYSVRNEPLTYIDPDVSNGDCNLFLFFYPTIHSEWIQLGSTTEKIYNLHSPAFKVEKVTSYQYETTPQHYQTVATTSTDSKNRSHTTQYTYALDYTDTTFGSNLMRSRHMHAQPLTTTTWINNPSNPISKTESRYAEITSNDPQMPYVLQGEVTTYLDGQSQNAAVNETYSYDAYGHIIQIEKDNSMPVAYLWGYGYSRPIAQIVGTTHAEAVASLTISLAALQSLDGDSLRTELDKLRAMEDVLVTTYTYDPLTGMTSATDPSGMTMEYEYDDFQRLKVIKDYAGKKVSEYEYQYAQ